MMVGEVTMPARKPGRERPRKLAIQEGPQPKSKGEGRITMSSHLAASLGGRFVHPDAAASSRRWRRRVMGVLKVLMKMEALRRINLSAALHLAWSVLSGRGFRLVARREDTLSGLDLAKERAKRLLLAGPIFSRARSVENPPRFEKRNRVYAT